MTSQTKFWTRSAHVTGSVIDSIDKKIICQLTRKTLTVEILQNAIMISSDFSQIQQSIFLSGKRVCVVRSFVRSFGRSANNSNFQRGTLYMWILTAADTITQKPVFHTTLTSLQPCQWTLQNKSTPGNKQLSRTWYFSITFSTWKETVLIWMRIIATD